MVPAYIRKQSQGITEYVILLLYVTLPSEAALGLRPKGEGGSGDGGAEMEGHAHQNFYQINLIKKKSRRQKKKPG